MGFFDFGARKFKPQTQHIALLALGIMGSMVQDLGGIHGWAIVSK